MTRIERGPALAWALYIVVCVTTTVLIGGLLYSKGDTKKPVTTMHRCEDATVGMWINPAGQMTLEYPNVAYVCTPDGWQKPNPMREFAPSPTDTYGVVEGPSMPFRITEGGEVGMLGFPITFDPNDSGAPIMTFDQESYEVKLDADEDGEPEWICTYHAGKKTENYADCSDPWNCQPPEGEPHAEPARYDCEEQIDE